MRHGANWQKLSPTWRRHMARRALRHGDDITLALAARTDSLVIERLLRRKGFRDMSLLGKMKHLTEAAQDFHKETEAALDGIAEKIQTGRNKREEAVQKHHAYYDAIIAGVDESTSVIDRLSNGPLHDDGGSSGGPSSS